MMKMVGGILISVMALGLCAGCSSGQDAPAGETELAYVEETEKASAESTEEAPKISEEAERVYYENKEKIDGYELFEFGDGKYYIQLPEGSIMTDNSKGGINNVNCSLNIEDKIITLSIGYGENNSSAHFTTEAEVEQALSESGVEINGDIVSFETLYENDEYTGYRYMIDHGDGKVSYTSTYFKGDSSLGFTTSAFDQEDAAMDTISNCVGSLYISE